ncbi:MAG TPA: GNAT family N-acetyltransferase [Cytophagales bacterium]|nr:GNAT family N-acetyltransferase [Cytophagales bacterium]HAA20043.1 GNAT family N-acetyltransferase [Cytophagales bacterium]HAP60108.1 GNAT family N-acetyltransferase [Cytophagales bacterium]
MSDSSPKKVYTFQTIMSIDSATTLQKQEIADFLFVALGEYGDPKEDILKCLDYALSPHAHQGGFVLLARGGEAIKGAVVINHTGMEGYIPPNILVYIAVAADTRGQGLGAQLMQKAMDLAKGDVALHVEYDNPAKRLYERLGFTTKYAEMRFHKS